MTDKFTIYHFIYPFQTRLQNRLLRERSNLDAAAFAEGCGGSDRHKQILGELWKELRDAAFVPDFRPHPSESLTEVYGIGPEEAIDEVIEPILKRLGLSWDGLDFTGFDRESLVTPKDLGEFLMKVVDAKNK